MRVSRYPTSSPRIAEMRLHTLSIDGAVGIRWYVQPESMRYRNAILLVALPNGTRSTMSYGTLRSWLEEGYLRLDDEAWPTWQAAAMHYFPASMAEPAADATGTADAFLRMATALAVTSAHPQVGYVGGDLPLAIPSTSKASPNATAMAPKAADARGARSAVIIAARMA